MDGANFWDAPAINHLTDGKFFRHTPDASQIELRRLPLQVFTDIAGYDEEPGFELCRWLSEAECIQKLSWASPECYALRIIAHTSSTARGDVENFKNRKSIEKIWKNNGCCEVEMAERSHWWTVRCFIYLTLSLSLWLSTYLPIYFLCIYLSIDLSIDPSLSLSLSFICLSVHLSMYLNFRKWSEPLGFSTFWLRNVLRAADGVHFFDIQLTKSAPTMVCFVHFHFELCFSPQRRAKNQLSSGQLAPLPPL